MHIAIQDPSLVICAVMSVLVCSSVVISKPLLLIRLKEQSMIVYPFLSASKTRLYNLMFFPLILSPSITTLRGTYFAALCITCFSSMRQYILGFRPTNSVMRCPLCLSFIMGPASFLLKLGMMTAKGTCSYHLSARSGSRVVHSSNSCYLTPINRTTYTSHTSCERCCPCRSVVR